MLCLSLLGDAPQVPSPLFFLPFHFHCRWWRANYQHPKINIIHLHHPIPPLKSSSSEGNFTYAPIPNLVLDLGLLNLVLDPILGEISPKKIFLIFSVKIHSYDLFNSVIFLFHIALMLSFHEWAFIRPLYEVFYQFNAMRIK